MVTLKWKLLSFDDDKLIKAMDRASRQALSRIGAHIRQTSRQSIRKLAGPSNPGRPPRTVTGLLKNFLLFGYDPFTKSVVIGPARISGFPAIAPGLLEFGGTTRARATVAIRKSTGRRLERGMFRPNYVIRKGQTIRHERRPYMGPAYDKELPNIPEEWRGSLGRL